MDFSDINVEIISLMKHNAIMKNSENQKLKAEGLKKKEEKFLKLLEKTSNEFITNIILRSIKELQNCSEKGYFQKKFYFDHFKNTLGPVKISTLVRGFRINGQWDDSIYKKIGYQKGTPFDRAVEILEEKGVQLKDISDLTKGLGFWLEVSFIDT